MRFSRLAVHAFRAIQHAEMDFGPGLNVLYGPNDLGKSTLATAIRAALLVAPGSAEASRFAPWPVDASPRVVLTFIDDDEHHWQIKKNFGSPASAELLHSKDGRSFSLDCKARQVEEKVRQQLGWGIPPPGGKGGPKGLPQSFLAQVLLAAQTDVDKVLSQSLAEDPDVSGKLRLQKALATLAQDPLFKRVLDKAQDEMDACFTPKGQRKRGQGSRFVAASDSVKKYEQELTQLRGQLDDSMVVEVRVRTLREQREEAAASLREAESRLAASKEQLKRTAAKLAAGELVGLAKAALSEINERIARVQKLDAELAAATEQVARRESERVQMLAACEHADRAVRAAEEAHRIATSAEGALEHETQRAQLAEKLAGLNAQRLTLIAQQGNAQRALDAHKAVLAAANQLAGAVADHEKRKLAREQAQKQHDRTERELGLAVAVLAYGRWRSAQAASDEATTTRLNATKLHAEASAHEAEAQAFESSATAREADIARARDGLPSVPQLQGLQELQRRLELAEAALGGGLSVSIRPLQPVSVRATLDRTEVFEDPRLATPHVLEAQRGLRLAIADLVELEITAGDADKRRAVEALRDRWSSEAEPVFERTGSPSVAALTLRLELLGKEDEELRALRQKAEQLRARAKSSREQAELHELQAAKLECDPLELAAKREAIGEVDLEVVAGRFAKLSKAWEREGDALCLQRKGERDAADRVWSESDKALELAGYRVTELEKTHSKLHADAQSATADMPGTDPATLLLSIAQQLSTIEEQEREAERAIRGLVASGNAAATSAAAELDKAKRSSSEARDKVVKLDEALEAEKASLNARGGQRDELRAQVERMDRNAASALLETRKAALAQFVDEPVMTDDEVRLQEAALAKAAQAHQDINEQFHQADGALSKVAGSELRERVRQSQDALAAARTREAELEVDADAWKLLRDTLRDV
ncbi:MAG: hypothetical protein JWN04_3940, partial [Myxococcaceae bacterium]|nr:hypothetical protein [Myxococcaceae bacterium]